MLFVDDDPENVERMRAALREQPFSVTFVTSLPAAVAVLAHAHVDVIVSNELVSASSGSTLLAMLGVSYPEVPRIVVGSDARLDSTARAWSEAKAFAFLTKTSDPSNVAGMIIDALSYRAKFEDTRLDQPAPDALQNNSDE